MTEYALTLGAVAIVVYLTYELMGQDVSVLGNNGDKDHDLSESRLEPF
jgi:hypothetical protein